MVEQEEKRWLRALLEGEVEPGSEEWEQVCTDSAFTRVREKVGAVARLDFTQQEDEVEGMWRVLVDRRKKGWSGGPGGGNVYCGGYPGRLWWWRWESEDGYRSGEWKENRWLW